MIVPVHENPRYLSLSLSSVCNAKCIWCPIGRRLQSGDKSKFMSMEIVDKILADTKESKVENIVFADMGEPLLHPQFKEIVTKFKEAHPKSSFILSSNFYLMDKTMAEFVLKNFSLVGLNIDGITEKGYHAVKGLPLNIVLGNLVEFIKLRNLAFMDLKSLNDFKGCHIAISVTTQPRYYLEIGQPEDITIPDETQEVVAYLRGLLEIGLGFDAINNTFIATWAERKRWNRPKNKAYLCTNTISNGEKCCIDTDGNLISCCMDYDSELKFGNVLNENLYKLWNSDKRKEFMERLLGRDYDKIGLPCSICQD